MAQEQLLFRVLSLYKAFGAKAENIVMLDSKGVIRKDRDELSEEKAEFATARKIDTLDEAMKMPMYL